MELTYLEDQETVVVEVNAPALEESLHFLVIAVAAVDSVLARVVLVRRARHDECRVRNNLKRVRAGLS